MIKAVFFDIGGTVHTQDATPESDRDYKERLWRYLEEHGIRTADTPDDCWSTLIKVQRRTRHIRKKS